MTLTPTFILGLIALACGILMLIPGGRWSRLPLAAIAIIALAVVQLGLVR
jgi:uncharacterized membrane protein YjjP (DUF1212 family)